MKRFLAMFRLTTMEQRVVILLLVALVAFTALKSRRDVAKHEGANLPPLNHSSPSPGIRP